MNVPPLEVLVDVLGRMASKRRVYYRPFVRVEQTVVGLDDG